MNKKNKVFKIAAVTVAITSATSVASFAQTNEKMNVDRISGKDRYETSLKILEKIKSDTAFIVDGRNYADALAVGPIAYAKGYPVVLTNGYENINEKLEKAGVKNVIIAGGEKTVSKETEESLKNKFSVKRIQGKDRYDTSVKLANFVGEKNVGVADGNGFADALSAGVFLGSKKIPLTLVDGKYQDRLPNNLVGKYTIGGENSVKHTFGKRISGKDRYETSAKIAEELNNKNIILTSGKTYPDALSSVALARKLDASIILTDGDNLTIETKKAIEKAQSVTIVGGLSSISDKLKEKVEGNDIKKEVTITTGGGGSSYRPTPKVNE